MTELELYKFLYDKDECNLLQEPTWTIYNNPNREDSLMIWIYFHALADFTELIGYEYLSHTFEVVLQENCIVLDLVPICESFGIDPENICKKNDISNNMVL